MTSSACWVLCGFQVLPERSALGEAHGVLNVLAFAAQYTMKIMTVGMSLRSAASCCLYRTSLPRERCGR
jgi:hypothetical protein